MNKEVKHLEAILREGCQSSSTEQERKQWAYNMMMWQLYHKNHLKSLRPKVDTLLKSLAIVAIGFFASGAL